jgi:hypothetical protein
MNNRMKNIMRILIITAGVIIAAIAVSQAQNKIDEDRMKRDIEVAENVLSTLIKQQLGKRNFFPINVQGTYREGYGVTFRLPMEFGGPMMFDMPDVPNILMENYSSDGFSYVISDNEGEKDEADEKVEVRERKEDDNSHSTKAKVRVTTKSPHARKINSDSARTSYNTKIIEASKDFMADYGDLINQLAPNEKIMVTNRMDGAHNMFWKTEGGRAFLSMEVTKADIAQFKQGKLNRDQFLAKIKTVNSETTEDLSPDLELLSSIFGRLYRSDLSKTYFVQESVSYERLKDYGVIYYMNVYSSTDGDYKRWNMPTLGVEDLSQEERDKKVKELYPAFEKNVTEDILEYGKTLKSLKDEEVLMFNIKITRCKNCGIPSTLEISVKNSVLKDYSSGKLGKEAALAKVSVKKGPNQ